MSERHDKLRVEEKTDELNKMCDFDVRDLSV